jgi:hypothetical protein
LVETLNETKENKMIVSVKQEALKVGDCVYVHPAGPEGWRHTAMGTIRSFRDIDGIREAVFEEIDKSLSEKDSVVLMGPLGESGVERLSTAEERWHDQICRDALKCGIVDRSYNTVRYGVVPSYCGFAVMDRVIAIGREVTGTAESIYSYGHIDIVSDPCI